MKIGRAPGEPIGRETITIAHCAHWRAALRQTKNPTDGGRIHRYCFFLPACFSLGHMSRVLWLYITRHRLKRVSVIIGHIAGRPTRVAANSVDPSPYQPLVPKTHNLCHIRHTRTSVQPPYPLCRLHKPYRTFLIHYFQHTRNNAANYGFFSIGPRAALIAPATGRQHVCGTTNGGFLGLCELTAATALRTLALAAKFFAQCDHKPALRSADVILVIESYAGIRGVPRQFTFPAVHYFNDRVAFAINAHGCVPPAVITGEGKNGGKF